jgi:hypothetical protein
MTPIRKARRAFLKQLARESIRAPELQRQAVFVRCAFDNCIATRHKAEYPYQIADLKRQIEKFSQLRPTRHGG